MLEHYTGTASAPGKQVIVIRYPEGTLAWLFSTATPGVTDAVLENPFTTDGSGNYDFYAPVGCRIIELV